MGDATAQFSDELARRGHEPLLAKARGRGRFELVDGSRTDTWLVTLERGDIFVSRDDVAADCVVRMEGRLFDAMAVGELNALAALLRGALSFEGDPELLVQFQRVLPAPPSRRAARAGAGREGDRS